MGRPNLHRHFHPRAVRPDDHSINPLPSTPHLTNLRVCKPDNLQNPRIKLSIRFHSLHRSG